MISNKVYDVLKWVALIALPAVATLYFALSQIWGFPYGEEIGGSISAISTCVGSLIGISTLRYIKEVGLASDLDEEGK